MKRDVVMDAWCDKKCIEEEGAIMHIMRFAFAVKSRLGGTLAHKPLMLATMMI